MESKDINSISQNVIAALNRESYAKNGGVWQAVGTSPVGKYYGFIVGGDGVTITDITYLEPEKYSGDITTFPFIAGLFYAVEFSSITISAGNLQLLKF